MADLFSDTWNEADRADADKLPGPILIIGASGFIGAKLLFSLASRRDDIYATARHLETSWRLVHIPPRLRPGRLLTLDITDKNQLDYMFKHLRPRTVFNLSAYGAYERQAEAARIHEVNYLGTLNVIRSLMETGCDAYVHAGSSSEYGLNCAAPHENGELRPNSDYAVSKAGASLLVKYYGQLKEFRGVALRLYSVYGPWEVRDRLVPTLVGQGLQGKYPSFVDPEVSRDFVYVDDCTRAFVRAALTGCRNEPGLIANVATGTKTSLRDVAGAAKKVFNIEGDPKFGTMTNRGWDVRNWFGDPKVAYEKLGWQHRISFEEGLKLTAEWEKAAASAVRFSVSPTSSRRISAVIACYKDNEAIPIMYERLTKVFQTEGVDYEIIFVNDRSPTADEDAIRKICATDSHVIGISHSRNFGSQSAFLSGMEVATGDAVVIMDGDLQDPPEIISDLVKKWNEGYEIVYGVRVRREASAHMQILYKLFYRVFRGLSDVEIPVDAGDFSLIDRRAVNYLMHLPERDVFLRGLRAWIGFKQIGVNYVRPERMFGRTTNNFRKNVWWAKKAIFSFSLKPLEYIQRLGLVMFLLSVGLGAFYLIHYFLTPPDGGKGITTVVLLTLALGGVQLFSLSILGDYLGKVLEEVKNRPRFIRSSIIRGTEVIRSEGGILDFVRRSREVTSGKYR